MILESFTLQHSLGVQWPTGLLTLEVSRKWNQPVEHLHLPDSLTRLDLGCSFIQPLKWQHRPVGITDLKLGEGGIYHHPSFDSRHS
jgi:hypothetical protein